MTKTKWWKKKVPERKVRNLEVVSVFYNKAEDGLPRKKYDLQET